MYIGVIQLTLHIPYSQSLKGKRRVVKSLNEKLKARFNVAVADVGQTEKWQTATIGIVCLNAEASILSDMYNKIMDFIIQTKMDFVIVDRHYEVIAVQ